MTAIHGAHLVETILRHGSAPPAALVVRRGGSARGLSRIVTLAEEMRLPVRWADDDAMAAVAGGERTDVALELSERADAPLEEMLPSPDAPVFVLAVEGVEDPHNLADILRTAFAAGVDLAILDAHARVMPRELLARSSAGASECLELHFAEDLAATLRALAVLKIETVAATLDANEDLLAAAFSARVALVVGGERRGLSGHALEACARRVSIPMARPVQSLSAAASAAVALFHLARNRG